MRDCPVYLRDVLDEFLTAKGLKSQTAWQYRHSIKELGVSLGHHPTLRDLRQCCLDWLEHRLVISGQSSKTVSESVRRLRTLMTWICLNRREVLNGHTP